MISLKKERFYFGELDAPCPNVPLSPGVSAILFNHEHRVLIMKRSSSDYWSLPGGRMEPGESAMNCCIRETLEETGLTIQIVRLISINTDPRSIVSYPDGNIHQSFVLCFQAEVIHCELLVSSESDGFLWLSLAELDSVLLTPDSRQNMLDAWANKEAAFLR